MQRQSVRPAVGQMLVLILLIGGVFAAPVSATGTPTFTIAKAQPTKAGYYVGEDVSIAFKLSWKYLSQNYTLDVELWNSTAKLSTLDDNKVLPGAGTAANGTYSTTYTSISGLTDKAGTKKYTIKVIDTSSSLLVAKKDLSILVAEKSLSLSVSWDDANDDRKVDVAESVTFTCYTTWAFVNESASYTLYVTEGGSDTLVGTVAVTAGSDSDSKTWSTSWNTAGAKTVTFTLKDSDGEAVAKASATVNVGQTETETASTGSWTELLTQNLYLVLIFACIAVVAVVFAKYRQ